MKSYDEETKAILTNYNEKKATSKMQNFLYFTWLAFLLITLALLIALSIY